MTASHCVRFSLSKFERHSPRARGGVGVGIPMPMAVKTGSASLAPSLALTAAKQGGGVRPIVRDTF
jgi:predicted NBD/HSP70 family sugar kinase